MNTNAHPCAEREEIQKLLDVLRRQYSLPVVRAWTLCQFGVHELEDRGLVCVDKDDDRLDVTNEYYSFCVNVSSLRQGQGWLGQAFASCKSSFCRDITQLSVADFPSVHSASECNLRSCFAIFLHGIHPGSNNYILELYLVAGEIYSGDPQALLRSMLKTMAPHLHNFKVVSEGEEEQRDRGKLILIHEVQISSTDNEVDYFHICQRRGTLKFEEDSGKERDQLDINFHDFNVELQTSSSDDKVDYFQIFQRRGTLKFEEDSGKERDQLDINENTDASDIGKEEVGRGKPGKVGDGEGKPITLELVEQHFGKKLEDVAAVFQVSQTTFKRRMRDIGIHQWPSRKRKNSESELIPPSKCSVVRKKEELTSLSKPNVVMEKNRSAAETASAMDFEAYCGDHIIRFLLSFSSGIEDLRCEIEKRLKLQPYIIKYKDEDDDWVLMACNEDFCHSMQRLKGLGKTLIQLLVIES